MFGKPLSERDRRQQEIYEGLKTEIEMKQFRINDLHSSIEIYEARMKQMKAEIEDLKRREYEHTPIYDRIRWSTGINPQE